MNEPLIVLQGLEGHAPAGARTALQSAMAPYADGIALAWWVIWFAVLAVMLFRTFRGRGPGPGPR